MITAGKALNVRATRKSKSLEVGKGGLPPPQRELESRSDFPHSLVRVVVLTHRLHYMSWLQGETFVPGQSYDQIDESDRLSQEWLG